MGDAVDESALFAPISHTADGRLSVRLPANHPGFHDPEYRRRRDGIATLASQHRPGDPPPIVSYTDEEHEVWRLVCDELRPRRQRWVCQELKDAAEELDLPTDHIPQLAEANATLRRLNGFSFAPAAGMVPVTHFFGAFAEHLFYSTQYIRHHSVPLYTPEPDVVHEVAGHGLHLASPRLARVYEAVGRAIARVRTDDAVRLISRVFWFTCEYGVVREQGQVKAYGAGLLSSFGEMEQMADAEIRELDVASIVRHGTYDVTTYQPVLYAGRSMDHVIDFCLDFFSRANDETPACLGARPAGAASPGGPSGRSGFRGKASPDW
jgi:phenylalanine-4-hydroxylase